MADNKRTRSKSTTHPHRDEQEDAGRRRDFARALTRSVFGRDYWDDDLERRLRDDRSRSNKRPRT